MNADRKSHQVALRIFELSCRFQSTIHSRVERGWWASAIFFSSVLERSGLFFVTRLYPVFLFPPAAAVALGWYYSNLSVSV